MTLAAHADVPIYEDRNSKFGIGFLAWKAVRFNLEQAKDFHSFGI